MSPTLSIDPGPTMSAYVLWDHAAGAIIRKGKVPNCELIHLVRTGSYGEAVIEKMACMGMAVGAEVFDTCYFIGRIIEAISARSNAAPRLVKRLEIKLHHCGSARAKDANIRQAVIDRLGPPGTKKNPGATFGVSADIWSALAIALFHHDTRTN